MAFWAEAGDTVRSMRYLPTVSLEFGTTALKPIQAEAVHDTCLIKCRHHKNDTENNKRKFLQSYSDWCPPQVTNEYIEVYHLGW